ncbi:MAG: thioredoxin family protein [Candidatus Aminicenantales bacterium]
MKGNGGQSLKTVCFHCGATNRFPADAFVKGKKILCGSCHNALPQPGMVLELSPERLYVLVRKGAMPIVLEFYSNNCPHCLRMIPVLERLARRRAGEIMVAKVNVDHYPELASGFGINSVPTFIIIRQGSEMGRVSGAQNEMDFSLWVANRT